MTEQHAEIVPFAVGFMIPFEEEDMLDATGHYDEASQVWVLDNQRGCSSVLMSGLAPERPPTTCQRMTKVGDKHWTTDTYTDD